MSVISGLISDWLLTVLFAWFTGPVSIDGYSDEAGWSSEEWDDDASNTNQDAALSILTVSTQHILSTLTVSTQHTLSILTVITQHTLSILTVSTQQTLSILTVSTQHILAYSQ